MRPAKVYRGSRARLRRIRIRHNWSGEMWFLLGCLILMLLVFIPWLIRHSEG